jgi:hypothetical protein
MEEKCRKIKALIMAIRIIIRSGLPSWAILCLADCIRRGGKSESFLEEIARLQKKAYEIQKKG